MKHDSIIDTVETIPNPLYKYYSFNKNYDPARIAGGIFFSSPLDFNDPYDCQTDVKNNTLELLNKNSHYSLEWLKGKLIELGFPYEKIDELIIGLCNDNNKTIVEVHKRQIEKLGILCLTNTATSITMWAYYTNHRGYCIEYDTTDIMYDITIDFIKQMDTILLNHLWNTKMYYIDPYKRCSERPNRCQEAHRLFPKSSIESISNAFFAKKTSDEILNFIHNVYIKRCWANSVEYIKELNMTIPDLFFDLEKGESAGKYHYKLDAWEGECEYRIGISLGGRNLIRINPKRIRSIIFSYNASTRKIKQILELTHATQNKPRVYKIEKGKSGFIAISVD